MEWNIFTFHTSCRNKTVSQLCVSYLDCWIIFINEVVLDELDGESALPDTSCPDHHKFIFSHACKTQSQQVTLLIRSSDFRLS